MLYASDPAILRRQQGRFARHLFLHEHVFGWVAEWRLIGFRPSLSRVLPSPQIRMFRRGKLDANQIGYLYSEMVFVADE